MDWMGKLVQAKNQFVDLASEAIAEIGNDGEAIDATTSAEPTAANYQEEIVMLKAQLRELAADMQTLEGEHQEVLQKKEQEMADLAAREQRSRQLAAEQALKVAELTEEVRLVENFVRPSEVTPFIQRLITEIEPSENNHGRRIKILEALEDFRAQQANLDDGEQYLLEILSKLFEVVSVSSSPSQSQHDPWEKINAETEPSSGEPTAVPSSASNSNTQTAVMAHHIVMPVALSVTSATTSSWRDADVMDAPAEKETLNELTDAKTKIEQLVAENAQLSLEFSSNQQKLNELLLAHESQKKEAEMLLSMLRDAEAEIEGFKNRIEELGTTERQNLQKLQESLTTMSILEAEHQGLREEHEEAKNKIAELVLDSSHSQETIIGCDAQANQIAELESQLNNYMLQNTALNNENDLLRQKMAEAEAREQEAGIIMAQVQERMAALEANNAAFQEDSRLVRNLLAEAQQQSLSVTEELKAATERNASLQQQVELAAQQIPTHGAELQKARNHVVELEDTIGQYRQDNQRLKQHLAGIEASHNEDMSELRRENEELQLLLNSMQHERDYDRNSSHDYRYDKEHEIEALTQKLNTLSEVNAELLKRVESETLQRKSAEEALDTQKGVFQDILNDSEKDAARVFQIQTKYQEAAKKCQELETEFGNLTLDKCALEEALQASESSLAACRVALEEAESQVGTSAQKTNNSREFSLDDDTLRSLFLNFFTCPIGKRAEAAAILASILGYEPKDLNTIRDAIGKDYGASGKRDPGQSLAKQFVNFLETESEKPTAVPTLPVPKSQPPREAERLNSTQEGASTLQELLK